MKENDKVRCEIECELSQSMPELGNDTINSIMQRVDLVLSRYDCSTACTDLTVCRDGIPYLVKEYLTTRSLEGLAKTTLSGNLLRLRKFFEAVQKDPNDVTSQDIRVYLLKYSQERHIKKNSLEGYRQTICGFFKWASGMEYISGNPTKGVKAIKFERRKLPAMTREDLEKLDYSCKTLRERAMVAVLNSTWCRISELAEIKISDINFNTREVELFGKGSKHRISVLNDKAFLMVRKYLEERKKNGRDGSDMLFVSDRAPYKGMSPDGLRRALNKLAKRAGASLGELSLSKITPHTYRRTGATLAISYGMPVQQAQMILGHSKIDTTMQYVTVNKSDMEQGHHLYVH